MKPLDLNKLQHDMLLCADRAEPLVDFLIEVDRLLLAHVRADAVENLLRESGRFSRWEMQRKPERFYRLGDLSLEAMTPGADVRKSLFRSYEEAWKAHLGSEVPTDLRDQSGDRRLQSFALFQLRFGEELNGFVMYKSRSPFSRAALANLRRVSQALAFVTAFQRIRLAQRERVKELTCLYRIGKATSEAGAEIDAVLRQVVECIPPAMQYPEITRARITIDGKVFESSVQGEARHAQRSEIVGGGIRRGMVEVEYVEDRPDLDEGPFLNEERRLLDLIAGDIALVVEHKRADVERLKLEEQVRRADRLATIGQLAAGIAHELNEPLGSILGFAQLAKKSSGLPAQVRGDLAKIESASLYAREVIRKLMLFARQTPPSKRPASINEIVRESVALLEARGARLGIRLECRLAEGLPEITMDPSQIKQVVINLIVNAIQAMPEGGTVSIETVQEGVWIALAVSDTGVGIAEQDRERLFEPFFTTKGAGEGTGLGLPVVHGIVAAHKGRIEVSGKQRAGSRFRVLLPWKGLPSEA